MTDVIEQHGRTGAARTGTGRDTIHHPRTVEEIQALVLRGRSLHALGTRHSFNDVADATELISLPSCQGSRWSTPEAQTVTVPGRMRYGELAIFLQEAGWALSNMASLPPISVAGSWPPATHGSCNGIRHSPPRSVG